MKRSLPSNNRTAWVERWGTIGYANRHTGRRKQLRLGEKKNFKETFPPLFTACKPGMEINRSKVWRTLQSPVFPWRTEVSFYSKLSLWSWLRMKGGGGGLTYLPLWIPFVTVCGAKSFGSNFFNYLHNDLHSRLRFHLFFSHVNWVVFSFKSDLESDLFRQLSWAMTAMTLCVSNKNSNAASKFFLESYLANHKLFVAA